MGLHRGMLHRRRYQHHPMHWRRCQHHQIYPVCCMAKFVTPANTLAFDNISPWLDQEKNWIINDFFIGNECRPKSAEIISVTRQNNYTTINNIWTHSKLHPVNITEEVSGEESSNSRERVDAGGGKWSACHVSLGNSDLSTIVNGFDGYRWIQALWSDLYNGKYH